MSQTKWMYSGKCGCEKEVKKTLKHINTNIFFLYSFWSVSIGITPKDIKSHRKLTKTNRLLILINIVTKKNHESLLHGKQGQGMKRNFFRVV